MISNYFKLRWEFIFNFYALRVIGCVAHKTENKIDFIERRCGRKKEKGTQIMQQFPIYNKSFGIMHLGANVFD